MQNYSKPQFGEQLSVAGHLQIRLAAVILIGGGDRLAEFRFQLRFSESPFFGGGGLIRRRLNSAADGSIQDASEATLSRCAKKTSGLV